MTVSHNTLVTLDYTVFDTQNNLLDSGASPLEYIHGGYGDVFPKIESALEGKSLGESIYLILQPDDSFGTYNDALVLIENKNSFEDDIVLGEHVEMVFTQSDDENEMLLTYRITAIEDETVVLDANHPLAGVTIVFDATVIGLREASEEEIEAKRSLIAIHP